MRIERDAIIHLQIQHVGCAAVSCATKSFTINDVVRSKPERRLLNILIFLCRVRSGILRTKIIHKQLYGAHKRGAHPTADSVIRKWGKGRML
jgi:hypothetical protein